MKPDKFNYSRYAEQTIGHLHDLVVVAEEIKDLQKKLGKTKKLAGSKNSDLEAVGLLNVEMAKLAAEIEEKQGQYFDLLRAKDKQIAMYAEADEVLENFESDKIN